MRKLSVLAVGAVLFACSAPSASEIATENAAAESVPSADMCPALTAGGHDGFVVSGQSRSFQVLLPPASFTGPRPVLFGFHGTSESGARFIARAKLEEFAARGFVVIAPDANNNGAFWPIWDAMHFPGSSPSTNPDVDLFDRLLSCASSHLSIDRTRVFATGHSAGGIFTNHLLRNRSQVLAGGIVASGVFDLTGSNGAPAALDGMLAIVTWGGDNDRYSGSTPTGVSVPAFSFVEQASLASKYYAAEPNVDQVQCRGNDVGHAWLPLNNWYIDLMLAHPKGTPASHALHLAPLPAGARAACSTTPYDLPPLPAVTCASTPRAGCKETCQLIADCAVENRTVGPSLGSALGGLGFTATSCGGCIQRCELGATTQADANVLSCISSWAPDVTCGGGIEGAFPLFLIVNQCCSTQPDAVLCKGMCQAIGTNPAAGAFFPVCQSL